MYVFLVALLHPFPWLVLAACSLALRNWWAPGGRWTARLLVACIVLIWLDSMPAVAYTASRWFEVGYRLDCKDRDEIEAIVVLGGGVILPTSPDVRGRLSWDSLQRCLAAAEVYRSGPPCPVIASGGKPDPTAPDPSVAAAMVELLIELGVPPEHVIIEAESGNTRQNAERTAAILRERQLRRIALVTTANHLPRSMALFQRQGLNPVPVGCAFYTHGFQWSVRQFLPSASALQVNLSLWHEVVGYLWLKVGGHL